MFGPRAAIAPAHRNGAAADHPVPAELIDTHELARQGARYSGDRHRSGTRQAEFDRLWATDHRQVAEFKLLSGVKQRRCADL